MSEHFINLVSQANPAARQNYQQPANGYPPSAGSPYAQQSPQILDPFFDDDDEMPDSSYAMGHPAPMQSQESGLPLRAGAAPPAGVSKTSLGMGDGMPQGWNFDDEEIEQPNGGPAFHGSAAFPGSKSPKEKGGKKAGKRRWKWPWQKEKELTGERIIALNNHPMNVEYISNFVSTSKYNVFTFVPKFFAGESSIWTCVE